MQNQDPRTKHPEPPFPEQTQQHPGSEQKMDPPPDYGEETYKGHDRLRGRVALITGGDSGIGRAVALAFAKEGADVAIAYLTEHEDAETTRAAVEKVGRKAILLPGDLSDAGYCREIVERTVEHFGRLDILVNNAAYQDKAVESLSEITHERLLRSFSVNIIAMFNTAREALPHLEPGSSIINVTSIQAYQPSPPILDYAATKGAIVTFTKGLAHELADKGIRVNAVAPGPVWTPLIPASFESERVAKHGTKAPLGRSAQPVELAGAFVFLASEDASYVTGEVLGVTGGGLLG